MEKKGVGRPRDGDPEETRREILRAAGEAFAKSGFAGATTRAVAARAGVNVATLHYHFGSKEGLYRAVLGNASRGPLPELPPGPAEERVSRLVDALFEFGAERPTLARLSLLDALSGPDASRSPDPRVDWLTRELEPLPPTNGRPAASTADAARAIVALVDATFLSAAPPTPSTGAEGEAGTPAPQASLPGEPARTAVAAAARRLIGLG